MSLFTRKQSIPDRRARRLERESIEGVDSSSRQTYQRNRTLTGSLSSEVHGASERHAELRSPRVQAHDLRHHRRRLAGALVGVLAVVGVLGLLVYEAVGTAVVTVKAESSVRDRDMQAYEQTIQSYLNSRPFERSRLTLDTTKLAAYLQENGHPEVASVSDTIEFAGIGAARITLEPRQPVVSWRTGNSPTMYVDLDGNAFERNYFTEPAIQVLDETGIQSRDNQILVSSRFLGFIGKAVGRLANQGLTVTKIVLPADTTRQIWVSVDGVGYRVKMSVDRAAGEQAQDTARSVRYLTKQNIQPKEYIDVRVSGRAYYK
ncbi:MAG: hypothetical protein WBP12_05300 [Candidatus Saccharimonas sp.]